MLQGQRARSHSLLLLLAFALVAGVGANLMHTLPAKAYDTDGERWVNSTWITVYMTSMQSQDTQGFNDGMGAWDQSLAPIFFAPGFGAQVVEQDYNAGQNGAGGWESDAVTGFDCNNGYAILQQAFVTLNIYYTQPGGSYSSGSVIQEITAHELGHAVGLAHSLDSTALMYPVFNYVNTPQTDDINGTNYIYGQSCH